MEAMGTDAKNLSARRDATNEREKTRLFSVATCAFLRLGTATLGAFVAHQSTREAHGLGDILGGSGDRCAYLMSAVGVFSAAVIAPLLALVVAMSVA